MERPEWTACSTIFAAMKNEPLPHRRQDKKPIEKSALDADLRGLRHMGGVLGRALRPYAARLLFMLTAPAAAGLMAASRAHPALTERLYSRHIYPVLSNVFSRLTMFPHACMAELLLIAFVLGLPAAFVIALVRRRATLRAFASLMATVLAVAALGYAVFVTFWGLNYNRLPLAENLHYREGTPTATELASTLGTERDAVSALLQAGRIGFSAGHSVAPGTRAQMETWVLKGYEALSAQNSLFDRSSARPKPVLLSVPWSYTGTEGIFIPFTFEPCYNTATPPFVQAFDMAHETAHFKGFAREDEANFVAYLADAANPIPYFQYAGHLIAFCYLSNALNETDAALWQKAASKLDSRAWDDINYYNAYIDRISGPVANAADQANNSYLQSQGQSQGVRSYDEFTTLLVERLRTQKAG